MKRSPVSTTAEPSPQEFRDGAKQAIRDLYKIFNGIIECRQCKGKKCGDLRGHYNIHFFHIENFLKAVEKKSI